MWTETDSPVGSLRLVERGGSLTAIEFEPHRDGDGRPRGVRQDDHPVLVEAARQLAAYFAGDLTDFDLPLAPEGTDFQRTVWRALCDIPYGGTLSYGELAARIGRPRAARAVGLANGRNPISIVVPCHRVVGSAGQLTGYGGGIERKRHLLDFERGALAARPAGTAVPASAGTPGAAATTLW